MAVVYSIRDWDRHFEISQSRKRTKHFDWVSVPTKHDGKSFRRLMMMPDGVEVFGTWVLIVQVAAKCPVRGTLADADGPLDTTDLAIKTGCPASHFDKALKVLSDSKIGWIVGAQWEKGGSVLPLQDKTEQTNQPTVNDELAAARGSHGGPAGGNGFVQSWGSVSHRLQKMGASRWREATEEAKQCGCDPALATKIIDHGESHGYGIGAIICRLSKAGPHLPVDAGWPEVPKPATAAPAAPDPRAVSEQRRYDIITAAKAAKWPRERINEALAAEGLDLI